MGIAKTLIFLQNQPPKFVLAKSEENRNSDW